MTTKSYEECEKMAENDILNVGPPLSKDELAAENAKLKKELEAMRQAAALDKNNNNNAFDNKPESKNNPVQIDEQKLAEKIRGLLMEDLNKQNQRILEQQKEELQLSLLTRLQLEAEKFNETVTAQQQQPQLQLVNNNDNNSNNRESRRKKKKTKRGKKYKHRSTSVPYLNNNTKDYAPVEPNVIIPPKRSRSQGKPFLHQLSTNNISSSNTIREEEEDVSIQSNDAVDGTNDNFAIDIITRPKSASLDDKLYNEEQRDFFEDDVVEEEEEFEPIDVGTLDDINEATAELLRKSRELTMTVGDNEYVKGLKSLGSPKKKNNTNKGSSKQQKQNNKNTKRKFKKKRKKSKKTNHDDDDKKRKVKNDKKKEEEDDDAFNDETKININIIEDKNDENANIVDNEDNEALKTNEIDDNNKHFNEDTKEEEEEDIEKVENNNNKNQLGPLKNTAQFSGKPPPDVHPLAVKLGKREWENEVARNILVLYKANMNAQRQQLEQASRTSSSMNQSTISSGSALLSEEGSRISNNSNTTVKSKSRRRSRKKLPKLSSQPAKPSSMMKIKYGGAAKKTHNPVQIWFAGAGNVRAVWDGLVVTTEEEAQSAMQKLTSDSKLVGELETLETRGDYFKYIAIVEAILTARSRIFERTESHWRLWRQLAVTANVFGVKYVDEGKFGQALKMLKHAQKLCDQTSSSGQDTLPAFNRYELKGFINDSMSYYYYKRGKPHAALQYAEKAMKLHFRLKQWEHVAKCHLHSGAILSKLQRHDEAIRAMGQVLKMVEDERLESGGPSSQKICLIAITYHNIAVEQLLLSRVMEACVSSQNARRLARLSLSYSNRWIKNFESTHRLALVALSTQKEVRTNLKTKDQATLFMDLSKTMYT